MIEKLIIKYINNLKESDIHKFALDNNIILSSSEINTVYIAIKNDWKILLYDDYKIVLNKYKNNLTTSNLEKIEKLIILYKDKYSSYL